ncbi:MAG: hypothetical protein RJA22_1361 [Verrucomicrobiota bacterium]|jgi:hypothetical protein
MAAGENEASSEEPPQKEGLSHEEHHPRGDLLGTGQGYAETRQPAGIILKTLHCLTIPDSCRVRMNPRRFRLPGLGRIGLSHPSIAASLNCLICSR